MNRVTQLKLALAAIGIACFAVGVRWEDERLRWGGIAALAAAFLLRFVRREEP